MRALEGPYQRALSDLTTLRQELETVSRGQAASMRSRSSSASRASRRSISAVSAPRRTVRRPVSSISACIERRDARLAELERDLIEARGGLARGEGELAEARTRSRR
jgi:hypothetical protein